MRCRYNYYIPRYVGGTPGTGLQSQFQAPQLQTYDYPQFGSQTDQMASNFNSQMTQPLLSDTTKQQIETNITNPNVSQYNALKQAPEIKKQDFSIQKNGLDKRAGGQTGMNLAGTITGAVNTTFNEVMDSVSDAKNGKKATVGGALAKGGKLAAAGSAFGPWGAAAGAAAGLILGSMGTKGKVDSATGEVSEPSGWLGIGRDKAALYKKGNAIQNANLAEQFGQQYALQAAQEQQQNDFTMAAYGDSGIGTSLAYLDDGELIRTPDGQISQIPEQGKPTDSNLMNVPTGTQVLSDKLKVPGTKFTFAELGAKLMKKSKPKYNDKRAQTSTQLNQQNNQKTYSQLLQLQEQLKLQRPMQKIHNIPAYDEGTPEVKPFVGTVPTINENASWGKSMFPYLEKAILNVKPEDEDTYFSNLNNMQVRHAIRQAESSVPYSSKSVGEYQNDWDTLGFNAPIWDAMDAKNIIGAKNATSLDRRTSKGVDNTFGPITNYLRHLGIGENSLKLWQTALRGRNYQPYLDKDTNHVMFRKQSLQPEIPDERSLFVPQIYGSVIKPATIPSPTVVTDNGKKQKPKNEGNNRKRDWITPALNAATLAGAFAQYIDTPRPKTYRPTLWTPKYGPTDYDINQQLAQTAVTDNVNRYNVANVNQNTGANMAFALQSGINRDARIADLYAQKYNQENQMKQHNVGIYNQWAPDIANRWKYADNINMQRRDNYQTQKSKALANMYTIAQQMNRDRLLRNTDAMRAQMLTPYLKASFADKDFKQLQRYFPQ